MNHGLYSNGLLEKFSIPGGTKSVPHDTLLKGMLFEYALLLANVNPGFCGDASIFWRVLAKGVKRAEDHYYLFITSCPRSWPGTATLPEWSFTIPATAFSTTTPGSSRQVILTTRSSPTP
jgi:hypothetical protein